jgi:ubiquinone/menaquinone biosynthesis C-methylase UbiE
MQNDALTSIHHFNPYTRDAWVKRKAATVAPGSKVLDAGAGTCQYRHLFNHCEYKAQDFMQYDGFRSRYGKMDFVSPIDQIPVEDCYFDAILCTEVLEHVPEPIAAIRELSRILKPGGRIFVTAPLGSGLHQRPYHFYGGYTPEWYGRFFSQFQLELVEITPNGGFFKHLAQECARVAWTFEKHRHLHGDKADEMFTLFNETLPTYLYHLDDKCFIEDFTVGYHVEGRKQDV